LAWNTLAVPEKELGGMAFLVTATGRYLRNVQDQPARNAGIILLNDEGTAWRPIWGFEAGAGPTSELSAHLGSHRVRLAASHGRDRVILHTHPDRLIALTYALDLDTAILSRLLWEMHAECIVVFPEGVGYLPWMMAGSADIARETAAHFHKRCMVLWQWHGMFASGATLDEAIGLVETADKAAGILLLAMQAGGVRHRPGPEILFAIAKNFGCQAEESFLSLRGE
jgi:rhamnulose-1-phosphate aldolase